MRKIIQISTTALPEDENQYGVFCLYALCDDGTVWECVQTFGNHYSEIEWVQFPEIPQPEIKPTPTPSSGSRTGLT